MNYFLIFALLLTTSLTTFAADSSWTDKWNLKADFRFRNEQIKDGANTTNTVITETERNRHRLRARLSAIGKVNDSVETTFRLATGDTTPAGTTTTNQDVTGYGAKKAFDLDLAYANWHSSETAQVWIGKSLIPYFQPGTSDLLLDTDFTHEGLAYKDQYKANNFGVFWNLGYSVLSEQHNSTAPANQTDVMMTGADLGITAGMGDAKVTLGAGALTFPNIKDTTQTVSGSAIAKGNSSNAGTYSKAYEVSRGFLEISGPLFATPVAFFIEYAKNAAVSDDNYAQLAGVKIGQLKEMGDLLFSVDYRELKKDSTVGALAESDGAAGGTDVISTRYMLSYQLDKGINLAAAWYDGRRNVSTLDIGYKRATLDVNFAF